VAQGKADRVDFSCGIVPVQVRAGEPLYLLVRHQAGHWGFPKGHPERGEDEVATALRELHEETGLRVHRVYPEHRFAESYLCLKRGHTVEKTVAYFVALITAPEVTLDQHELRDSAWLPFTAAVQRITFAEGKHLLRAAQQAVLANWTAIAAAAGSPPDAAAGPTKGNA
jgi:8-oxo-dGTP pyrophosphatase MutT (NUDIX family)